MGLNRFHEINSLKNAVRVTGMIIGKLWRSFKAQVNKLANYFWTADPIAQMQYEYDQSIEQLKAGKEGLAQYRALVERVAHKCC